MQIYWLCALCCTICTCELVRFKWLHLPLLQSLCALEVGGARLPASHNVFVFIAAIQYSNGDWMKMTERGHKLNASIKTLQNFTKEQLKIAGLEDGLQ